MLHTGPVGSLPDHAVVCAANRLREILAVPNLSKLVAAYFEQGSDFAGMTFTELGSNPPDKITPDDLLAVALLDISWRPPAVRALLETQKAEISSKLAGISATT